MAAKDGPVWRGWFTHVALENRARYKQFLTDVHRHELQAQKEAGLLRDFKFVTSRYRSPNDWNVAVLMQYENLAGMDVPDEEFSRVQRQVREQTLAEDPSLRDLVQHKDEWRVSIAQRVFREMSWD